MVNDNASLQSSIRAQTHRTAEVAYDGGPHRFKSSLVSRNITVMRRRTSVRLEPEMWRALREISRREQCTIHDLCSLISIRKNPDTSLTAAIRVFLMLYFRAAASEEGHSRAGHGNFNYMKARARLPDQEFVLPKKGKRGAAPNIQAKPFEDNGEAQAYA